MKLTEKEFETIIEALDKLPSTKTDGKLLSQLIVGTLCKGDEETYQKMQEDLKKKEAEEEEEEERKTKKLVVIIQGKLYMMQNDIVESSEGCREN